MCDMISFCVCAFRPLLPLLGQHTQTRKSHHDDDVIGGECREQNHIAGIKSVVASIKVRVYPRPTWKKLPMYIGLPQLPPFFLTCVGCVVYALPALEGAAALGLGLDHFWRLGIILNRAEITIKSRLIERLYLGHSCVCVVAVSLS